ncbi:YdcF family protein [Cellulomonas sp. 179-A 4D5 NHS]|uniref:YdcF family protein n=1 Tax=Cellulomonas sp. 179-A 4D5 NHS TaxID=3142378 RepID=UPI0039A1AA77
MTGPPLGRDLNLIAAYLARRDSPSLSPAHVSPFDVLILCGSAVLPAVDVVASTFHAGLAPRILVSGGVGHSTEHLAEAVRNHPVYRDIPTQGRSEAGVLTDILTKHHRVPESNLLLEDGSTNCGENADYSVDLLRRTPGPWRSLTLVQDPTMQRRTHECFRRSTRDIPEAQIHSYAPFIPAVDPELAREVTDGQGCPTWSLSRFAALLLGEIRRLQDDEDGYGPRGAGFIDHVDLPSEVVSAHERIRRARPEWATLRDTPQP